MRPITDSGVGRRGAISLAIALGLAALLPGTAVGSQDLEKGSTPRSTGIIKFKPDAHAMLVGDRVVIAARVCNAEGKKCKPAKSAKWRAQPDGLVAMVKRRGAVAIAESLGTAGTVTLTVTEDGVSGSTVITIGDAPEPILADVERDDLFLYVLPESSALGVYGVQRFNAWGCPIDTASDLGANGTPDGLDDECEPLDINSVAVGELAPLRVAALGGPAVALRLDGIPGDPDGEVAPLVVQVVTAAGAAVRTIRARFGGAPEAPFFDVNGDGVVSPADHEALTAALAADGTSISATDPGYIASYDVNGDYRLDAGDLTFLDRLAPPERSS